MWSKHPKYLVARQRFISDFTPYRLTHLHYSLPKVIFICGGDESVHKNRGKIERYFEKHIKQFITFRAEDAWKVISKDKSQNALELESWLADFSDVIIILVESFGTVAELGAFSLSGPLRKKLLPVLDEKYKTNQSFINTGPVKWVDKDSKYAPSIYANYDSILTSIPEIESRITRRTQDAIPESRKFGLYKFSNKVLLFFIVYIIVSLGPITIDEIAGISHEIIKYKDLKIFENILSIGLAINVLSVVDINGKNYYTCTDFEKLFRDKATNDLLRGLQKNRARSLSSLIYIKEFKDVLNKAISDAA